MHLKRQTTASTPMILTKIFFAQFRFFFAFVCSFIFAKKNEISRNVSFASNSALNLTLRSLPLPSFLSPALSFLFSTLFPSSFHRPHPRFDPSLISLAFLLPSSLFPLFYFLFFFLLSCFSFSFPLFFFLLSCFSFYFYVFLSTFMFFFLFSCFSF